MTFDLILNLTCKITIKVVNGIIQVTNRELDQTRRFVIEIRLADDLIGTISLANIDNIDCYLDINLNQSEASIQNFVKS